MKNWCVAVSAFMLFSFASRTDAMNVFAPSVSMESNTDAETGDFYFERAYVAYVEGKQASRAEIRNEKYAEAIRAISQVTVIAPDSPDVLLLASQIYRSKGGTAFAKEYFARAEAILVTRIAASPKDIRANLDYAIACYAGDARFKDNYDAYRKIAFQYAEEVIRLVSQSGKINAAHLRAMAVAYLIKGNTARCGELLFQAAQSDAVSKFYSELFADTVAQGKWLWPVSADGAEKEFLLYVLMDGSRYSGLSDKLKMADGITK